MSEAHSCEMISILVLIAQNGRKIILGVSSLASFSLSSNSCLESPIIFASVAFLRWHIVTADGDEQREAKRRNREVAKKFRIFAKDFFFSHSRIDGHLTFSNVLVVTLKSLMASLSCFYMRFMAQSALIISPIKSCSRLQEHLAIASIDHRPTTAAMTSSLLM